MPQKTVASAGNKGGITNSGTVIGQGAIAFQLDQSFFTSGGAAIAIVGAHGGPILLSLTYRGGLGGFSGGVVNSGVLTGNTNGINVTSGRSSRAASPTRARSLRVPATASWSIQTKVW